MASDPANAATLPAALARASALSRQGADPGEVTALLREDGPLYAELTSGQAELARGRLLLALGLRELPSAALPYALDDIAGLHGPFPVAAAARALRTCPGAGEAGAAAPLLRAVLQYAARDETVRPALDEDGPDTTVAVELLRTLAGLVPWEVGVREQLEALRTQSPTALAPRVSAELARTLATPSSNCCCGPGRATPFQLRRVPANGDGKGARDTAWIGIDVEDQDGRSGRFGACLAGRRSVLAFFYTRCDNPEKCSLTVTRLARLRHRLEQDGLGETAGVFGMTYDPAYDTAARLRAYGAARGMRFSPGCRLLRTVAGFEPVRRALALRVGYGTATVNHHAVEFAVLDEAGQVVAVISGQGWDEADAYRLLTAPALTHA